MKNFIFSKKNFPVTISIFLLIIILLNILLSHQEKHGKHISSSQDQTIIYGKVNKIRDGDTIVVGSIPIRLSGLTCDELGTPLGDDAKLFLHEKILNKFTTCVLDGSKTYDREVGKCKVDSLGDIGILMISSRLCGRCPKYDKNGHYLQIQKSAGPFIGVMPSYCN